MALHESAHEFCPLFLKLYKDQPLEGSAALPDENETLAGVDRSGLFRTKMSDIHHISE